MTVLHLISSGGFYGAESMLLSLAEAQLRAGLHPVIAVFRDERDPHIELFDRAAGLGIKAHLVACAGRWDRRAVNRIRTLIDRQAELVHCHGYKADLYGYAAARRRRIPLVSTCHNWPDSRLSMRAYAVMDRFVLRWFDRVTTPSKYVAAVLRKSGIAGEKLTVVENGIDVARFRNAEATLRRELPPHEILVGAVGRLVAGKGGSVLLRAARTVLSVYPATAFVFIGDGPCRSEWEALAVDHGIRDRVFFTGTRADMPNVYASLDILALPSFEEAMPMCLLEGLAAARPIVATRVGGVPKLIEAGVSGELIEAGDSDALSDAILRLIRKPGAARLMGRNGQEAVGRSFSSDAMAHNYLAVYEGAMSRWQRGFAVTTRNVDAI